MSVYGSDGKTVVSSSPGKAKVKGTTDDAVKAAIDEALSVLMAKLR